MQHQKGFTLIELLIVIAIIAVLSVVVILVLNPAQLLAQARDSNRMSDIDTLKRGMLVYLNDAGSNPLLASSTSSCYTSTSTAVTANCRFALAYSVAAAASSTASRNIDGTGWVGGDPNGTSGGGPNFSIISSGAPFPLMPVDPVNNATYFYSYVASTSPSNVFKFGAHMESTKYQNLGSGDVESTDGGTNANVYEAGTNILL